jgi:phosphodiesterase/alkaline phosphatase D-like protein
MRKAARTLGLAAVVIFVFLTFREGVPNSSYYYRWEQPAQLSFLIAVFVGYALAWKWEGVGGGIMVIGSVGLGVLASTEYNPLLSLLACLAFLVPGVFFILYWQRTQSLRMIAVGAAGMLALMLVGAYASDRVYSHFFGPTHPESALAAQPVDIVEWMWSGGVTDSQATVIAKLEDDSANVRLVVSESPDFSGATRSRVEAADDENRDVVSFHLRGLQADTEYHYAIESRGRLDAVRRGRFRTFPSGPASFTFAFSSCARLNSNGAVFDAIREVDPLFFLVTGDFFYANIRENNKDRFRDTWDQTLTRPAQAALYQSAPVAYTWDDHDFAGNGSDGTSRAGEAAQTVYREVVPHYGLPAGEGAAPIYQAFTVGRARIILTDTRSARSPAREPDGPAKTMLGEEQKAWFKRELIEAKGRYPLIIWVNADPWIDPPGEGKDTWGGYSTERRELADFIADNGISGVMMLSGDAHMLAIDDGSNSDYATSGGAGFPIMHAAALDRHGRVKGGPYSEGAYPGSGQFGLMTVSDDGGTEITVAWSGRNWENEALVSYGFTVPAAGPPSSTNANRH